MSTEEMCGGKGLVALTAEKKSSVGDGKLLNVQE